MRTFRTIFIFLGLLFVFFQIIVLKANIVNPHPNDLASTIGYYIGIYFFLAIGITLLVLARRLHKKIRKKEEQDMINAFLPDNEPRG